MWTSAKEPSLAEIEAMAHKMLQRLPKGFRDLCEGVIIRVDDFPTEEVLDEMQAESEFDLLGLFQGVGLPFRRARLFQGRRPPVSQPRRYRAAAKHDLAISPPDPGLLGRT